MRVRLIALVCFLLTAIPSDSGAQDVPLPRPFRGRIRFGPPAAIPVKPASAAPSASSSSSPSDVPDDAGAGAPIIAPVDPEVLRLHLVDGSIVHGKFEVPDIAVATQFGTLTVPVQSIKAFVPGLASYPELHNRIQTLIEALGSDDYNQRESARKALADMGLQVEPELRRRLDDSSPERVRHIKALLEGFASLQSQLDEETERPQSFQNLDTVETTEFTVLGRISPLSFRFVSTYGPLTIKLADIRRAQRTISVKEDQRKLLAVDGQNLVQRAFKSSGLRVERGDKITVTATGSIHMAPWGQSSTPDGSENFGWYAQQDQIPGGALVAKIGDSGKVFRVGSKLEFTAERSGSLQFGIAMQHQYARGNYQYPGQYDLKVKVAAK